MDLELSAAEDDDEMSEIGEENVNENAATHFHKLFPCSDAYQVGYFNLQKYYKILNLKFIK